MHLRRSGLFARCFLLAALAAAAPAHADSLASKAASTAAKAWSGAHDVAIYAMGLIGVSYKFGGDAPDTGFDCSGLVRHVFEEVTGVSLPRTAKEMGTLGARVASSSLQPGDLVFFNTRRYAFSHVGIYLGDNRFVHAPSRGSDVQIASLDQPYWQKHFNGARRVIGVIPALVPNVVSPAIASDFVPRTLVAAPSPFALDRADLTP
jgi:cell wall-associated NlpC family hydrolase